MTWTTAVAVGLEQSLMRESKIERYLTDQVNAAGFYCHKFTRPGRNAAFDRIIPIYGGKVIWIETKRTDLELTDAQERERIRLQKFGHIALCINSYEAVDRLVRRHL